MKHLLSFARLLCRERSTMRVWLVLCGWPSRACIQMRSLLWSGVLISHRHFQSSKVCARVGFWVRLTINYSTMVFSTQWTSLGQALASVASNVALQRVLMMWQSWATRSFMSDAWWKLYEVITVWKTTPSIHRSLRRWYWTVRKIARVKLRLNIVTSLLRNLLCIFGLNVVKQVDPMSRRRFKWGGRPCIASWVYMRVPDSTKWFLLIFGRPAKSSLWFRSQNLPLVRHPDYGTAAKVHVKKNTVLPNSTDIRALYCLLGVRPLDLRRLTLLLMCCTRIVLWSKILLWGR